MQEVDSTVLSRVAKLLRLSTSGSQLTEFQDEILQQVLDVGRTIRVGAGLPQFQDDNYAVSSVTNVHTAANTVTTQWDPYEFTATTDPSFDPLDTDFELWAVMWAGIATVLAAEFGSGILRWDSDPELAIGSTVGAHSFPLQMWNSFNADQFPDVLRMSSSLNLFQLQPPTTIQLPWRIPRGGSFAFATTSTGAGNPNFQLNMLLGVVPRGFGQDFAAGGGG